MKKGKKDINKVMYFQNLLYIFEIIHIKLINRHQDFLLASYFGIKKTEKLVTQNYYWLMFHQNVKAYVRGFDFDLVL